ncbi:hypothetical protein [Nannocystis radixulma]|uniref:Uncharacterized protein n=1 Tax=Nannocystis radixulma TaxID=2995305 RepID=A0ABT5B5D0_9BACT|nr:hypothetical protein [Nannocystis radixulma]MDC0669335.1 hypothetical protein [Nannocystis radixulma]
MQAPVSLEDVAVDVADDELEISFRLREVGPVSVALRAEDDGSGRGLVTVGGAVVAEVGFVDGAVAWQECEFAGLSSVQAQAVAASVVQVWQDDAVMAALDRWSLKCTWAGQIAESTIGVAVFAGCGLVTKSPKCYGHGFAVQSVVAGYITDKCNGAQNK